MGYSNITIGNNNNYSGLAFTPMPPTFQYYIVKADATYNTNKSGVFTQHTIVDSEITAKDLKTTTKTSKTITVTLKDDEGKVIANKQIKVSINGKESTITTNDKGVANIKINYANAGIYYCTLTFLGDEDYKASFKTVKITVNKQTTKATMPAKKYKAKKAKKMTFTLKDASKKAIKGKKITFTVKGKTYSAKTNAKGIATVTIKLTKKGKYAVTAKFAGDNTYKAISKKAKLTITK
jgi:VCBS repeat-containing protein